MKSQRLIQVGRLEIFTVIEKSGPFGGVLWQNEDSGRALTNIIVIQTDIKQDRFIIRIPALAEVKEGLPLYIRLNYRSVIFRLEPSEFRTSGDKIICKYPENVRALEIRQYERYVLSSNSYTPMSLLIADIGSEKEFEVKIIDISHKGLGVLISGEEKNYFRNEDQILIRSIDSKPLKSQLKGIVHYLAPKGYYLKKGDVRIGLSLNEPLEKEIFEKLKRKCSFILSA